MVIFAFWLGAMLLTLLALALLLPPLLRSADRTRPQRRELEHSLAALKQRHSRGEIDEALYSAERERLSQALVTAVENDQPSPPPARNLAISLLLALPVAAIALYFSLGRPEAIDLAKRPSGTANGMPMQMAEAMAALEERLRSQPDDVQGWLLLARSYRSMERFPDMLRATSSAFALSPQTPEVLVEHAEAKALNSPTRRLEGEPRQLLEQALTLDPAQQKALWLLGVAELQAQRPQAAIDRWQHLQGLLAADDPVRASLDRQIATARAALDPSATTADAAGEVSSATDSSTAASSQADTAAGPQVRVTVELDDNLRGQLRADSVLFVFARSPAGGPPLAIRRLAASTFPVELTLSQADRMLEGVQIETGASVSIGARVSHSGQAQAQSGDLEAEASTLTLGDDQQLTLRIDQRVP